MSEKESKKSMNSKIIMGVIAVVFAAAGFFGGMKYQQGKTPAFGGQFRAGQGVPNGRGGTGGQAGGNRPNGFRPVSGEVVNIDDKSMTVKMMDGSTKIVILSDNATYNKSADGSKSDIKAGTQIAVFGTENSDGSVTAQNVQINPVMRMNGTPRP